VPSHQDEEERKVCALAHAVTVRVDTRAHLVPHHPREEGRRVDRRHLQREKKTSQRLWAVNSSSAK
jgi:hypothetical protein